MNRLDPISSPHNEKLAQLSKLLKQKKERSEQNLMVLEGIHLVTEFLEHRHTDESLSVFVHEDKQDHPEIQMILNKAPLDKCYSVQTKAFNRIKEFTSVQDILAIVPIPSQKSLPYQDSCLILERIQDTGNVGTILRSAAAAGIQHVLLDSFCADAFSPKVLRSAMGAHFLLDIYTDINPIDFLKQFQGTSFATALSPDAKSLYQTDLTGKIAIIVGNEGAGISEALQQAAKHCIQIPMLGNIESLNVAMATTICLFERVRQLS